MGSTGPEAEKSKSRFVRAAVGGRESTGSGEGKMSEDILKQLAELKVLVSSYRRDLDKQQQKIEVLMRNYQTTGQGHWNLRPESRPVEQRGLEQTIFYRNTTSVPRESPGLGHGPVRNGGRFRTRCCPQSGDTCQNCGRKSHLTRECGEATASGNTLANHRVMGGSVSIVTDGRNGVSVYLTLVFGELRVYGLLDAGCDTSVVSEGDTERMA